jgi:hypothetical protein
VFGNLQGFDFDPIKLIADQINDLNAMAKDAFQEISKTPRSN